MRVNEREVHTDPLLTPKLSRRSRAASADTDCSSPREPIDAGPCLEEVSEKPEAEGPTPRPEVDTLRDMGNATLWRRGEPPVKELVRECTGGGKTKRSAIEDGGDFGKEVRMGRLPGEPDNESLCWFLRSVGVNSGPSSWDMKREDSNDSRSTDSKFGDVR